MIPRATYRLQFNRRFTFADATRLARYLAELGVSHLYASPWLKARAGSEHGYDIIDHTAFNPELGGEAGFELLSNALSTRGIGQILDFVPNHMGIAEADNTWWLDVLEWGRASPYSDYFDIDWAPAEPKLRNKVLLPQLGDHYGTVLEHGELEPRFDPRDGTFSVWYYTHRFPLTPGSYPQLIHAAAANSPHAAIALEALADAFAALRAGARISARRTTQLRQRASALKARLAMDKSLHESLSRGAAAFAGRPDDPATFRPLHKLLENQNYRLAYWRVAADEINYRRFFDINALAGLRVEKPQVFAHIHLLVARLLEEGKLDGLRIDHLDGLFDPAQYCRRLRRLVKRPFYLVVEKILARHERLRAEWPIEGTTGYDFLSQVTGLLVDARSQADFTRAYQRFTGRIIDFDDELYSAKKQILRNKLSSELHVLARQLDRIAQRHWRTRDYTLQGLTRALEEVVAAFPVYRTYMDNRGTNAEDCRDIAWAVAQARKRREHSSADIFDFIESALTADLAAQIPGSGRRRLLRFAMKFQQYTSPVMAKGFEDTALYRYHRLIALNDVGGDPRQFGLSVPAFHHANLERAQYWPHAMLTTATHDTKRGEDVRARLAGLTAIAPEWSREARRWARLNRSRKLEVEGQPAPDRNDEYLLYQTLIGAWPIDLAGRSPGDEFTGRIQAYMTKALREAKLHSSWSYPATAYEDATSDFIARILDPESGRLFLDAFLPLQKRIAELGVHNSLVQLALKLTCPGVPDIYQGCELWDLSLVDPDNRREVDFQRRVEVLRQVQAWIALDPERRIAQVAAWREHWHDGTIKLFVLHRLLQLRSEHPDLFAQGNYQPIELHGVDSDDAIAFERLHGAVRVIAVAILRAGDAGAIAESLSIEVSTSAATRLTDVLTGRKFDDMGCLSGASLFKQLPVAVLIGPAAE